MQISLGNSRNTEMPRIACRLYSDSFLKVSSKYLGSPGVPSSSLLLTSPLGIRNLNSQLNWNSFADSVGNMELKGETFDHPSRDRSVCSCFFPPCFSICTSICIKNYSDKCFHLCSTECFSRSDICNSIFAREQTDLEIFEHLWSNEPSSKSHCFSIATWIATEFWTETLRFLCA